MWYVTTTKENLTIKAHFLAPCINTPNAHITTFVRQLYRRQLECKDHGVTVTDDKNLDHFVAQMYACGLFEAKLLDNWEEGFDKSWGETQPHFIKWFNKEQQKLWIENA